MQRMILNDLSRRMKETLNRNEKIAVFGWKVSNHSKETTKYPTWSLLFYEKIPNALPSSIGFAIATKFISHPDFIRLKSRYDTPAGILKNNVIKDLLETCRLQFEKP